MKSRAMAVVIAAGVVRLVIAATAPLFPDEAYYWEWSRHLSTGYFDHPPLVAWLIHAGTLVFGDTPLGVRVVPVLAGTFGTLMISLTARRLGGERAAFTAALVFAVMPLSAAGLVLATPDAGMIAASTFVIYAVVRAFEHSAGSRASFAWWCVAGAAQGVAFWSKYTAILIPAGIAIALFTVAEHRVRLRESGPYVATLIASIIFAPVLWWNSQHQWISFTFQLQHGLVGSGGSILRREAELLGGQLGVISPVLLVMMLIAVVGAVRGQAATARTRLLAVPVAFILLFFTYSATQRRVEANWPALGVVLATLLLASRAESQRWDRWFKGGATLALGMTLIAYVDTYIPILPIPLPRDPAARAAGWGDLAGSVDRTRDSLGTAHTFLAGNRYQEAAEISFQLRDHPQALAINVDGRRNQYDLWPQFPDRAVKGDNLVLVVEDVAGGHPAATALAPYFDSVTPAHPVVLERRGRVIRNLRVWVLSGWRGTWPSSPIRSWP